MRRSSESPESGSARKRQRLSSPTYDEYFPITQHEVQVFEEAERRLSQGVFLKSSERRRLPSEEPDSHEESGLESDVLGGRAHKEQQNTEKDGGWSSSPPIAHSASQAQAAEDAFFSSGTSTSGGFMSAASFPSKPSAKQSGFSSAAALPFKPPSITAKPPGKSAGFAPATSISDASRSTPQGDTITLHNASPPGANTLGGFGPASAISTHVEEDDNRPPSPPPVQPDYDAWFDTDTSILPPDAFVFKSARTILAGSQADSSSASQNPPTTGFSSGLAQLQRSSEASFSAAPSAQVGFSSVAALTGAKSKLALPSAETLARAAEKMRQWEAQDAPPATMSEETENTHAGPPTTTSSTLPFRTPLRPALRPMENHGQAASGSPAQLPDTPLMKKSMAHAGIQVKNKPFKSPLVSRQPRGATTSTSISHPSSALNPTRNAVASSSKLPALFPNETAPVTPARPAPPAFTSPTKGKSLGMTPRRVGGLASGKSKFTTPFKQGMAPGEPGRAQLDSIKQMRLHTPSQVNVKSAIRLPPSSTKGKAKMEYKFFDLNSQSERKTLAASGLRPESYTEEELEDMGINVSELRQMTPANARYYSFHFVAPVTAYTDPPEPLQLGHTAAYTQLRELGCTLATQEWVTNHYCLILWKLAAMVCLEPEREQSPKTKRWCWSEVMRQLRYRYERELNGGSRPALRLISTEDAPATCPMVLCVSSILGWSPARAGSGGQHPELEVTDGWYRMRAKIDLPLARAVRRGLIRVGSKLSVSGAKLSGDRKEACEILEAYDNTYLELCGNSSHLAPWHAKMGFVKEPFIATLDSLTADGGNIPATDLVVDKVYPIAYLEFVKNEDGSTTKFGPRGEKEELKARDVWLAKRDNDITRIRTNLENAIHKMEKAAERLANLAGPRFREQSRADDLIPDHIEDLYDEMMEECIGPSQIFGRLSATDAGWLRIHTLEQVAHAQERLSDDIERELQHVCPERNVRDFRVVVVRDAQWSRKEPTRTAQITLWDPMRMVFSEGGTPGDIRAGQRFMVTNLQPNQPRAWMPSGPDSVIYLVSKKNTRWTNIRPHKS